MVGKLIIQTGSVLGFERVPALNTNASGDQRLPRVHRRRYPLDAKDVGWASNPTRDPRKHLCDEFRVLRFLCFKATDPALAPLRPTFPSWCFAIQDSPPHAQYLEPSRLSGFTWLQSRTFRALGTTLRTLWRYLNCQSARGSPISGYQTPRLVKLGTSIMD